MRRQGNPLDPMVWKARLSGRSWWAMRYTDGTILHEHERDWGHLPLDGRQALRLYCPDGQVAELGDTTDSTGRFFQLKQAVSMAQVAPVRGGPRLSGAGRRTLCHAIGRIHGTDGQATLYAWEYGGRPPEADPELLAFLELARRLEGGYQKVEERLGLERGHFVPVVRDRTTPPFRTVKALIEAYGGKIGLTIERANRWSGLPQLVGPFEDNPYDLRYGAIGPLEPRHLGMAAA